MFNICKVRLAHVKHVDEFEAMLVVGITGGIGSGKSTVCRIFEMLRIPVYNADERAKALYIEKDEVRELVINLLGEEAYVDGQLNRTYIAQKAFSDQAVLSQLNGILHPAVAEDFETWKNAQNSNLPYILKEAAIMIEAGSHKSCDQLILISAPEEVRIARVMERDNANEAEVKARIQKQWTDEQKKAYADFVIENDANHSLIEQVMQIHEQLIALNSK